MSVSAHLLLLSILLCARCVSADGGDDFANNLFSDLGPLLALFGERVTMQFMSEAISWADNIILAMAPLGIITAIVGAIRVGGPSWLKAVIGRARENLAVAEAELMSSTSREVCELWNGQEIVRCMGSPSVVEFICLLPKNGHTGKEPPEVELFDPDGASKDEDAHLEPIDLSIKDDLRQWLGSRKGVGATDSEDSLARKSPQNIIIKRSSSRDAPNISLNTHWQTSRWELRAVAAFGTILQVGVLVYSGFATYHPTLRFSKDGKPIESYAYPCTAVGTLILVAGMMLCAHVVESSTVEKRFQPKTDINMKIRMVWLQQTKTVSDQVFGSFALYGNDELEFITTSRRSQKDVMRRSQSASDKGDNSAPDDPISTAASETNRSTTDGQGASIDIQFKTVLGTMTTLTGFILQFVGLRGLHWSASIAQLGAVFLMVCLKAWVRRGLATPPKAIPLPPGYELDWFAKTLGQANQSPWNVEKDPDTHGFWDLRNLARIINRKASARTLTQNGAKDVPESLEKDFASQWRIASTGGRHLGHQKRIKPEGKAPDGEQGPKPAEITTPNSLHSRDPVDNGVSDAQAVLNIRKNLGYLAKWRGPASSEAVSLARAIEITMDTLIGSSMYSSADPASTHSASPGTFYWSLDAYYGASGNHAINFHIQRQPDGKWKAYANEYEAALSLWLSSVEGEKSRAAKLSERKTEHSVNKGDDARLRMEESKGTLGLRLLGLHTTALRRDLQWWVPKDLLRIFEIQEHEQPQEQQDHEENDQEDILNTETHIIIGYGQKNLYRQETRDGITKAQNSIRFSRKDLPEETTGDGEDEIVEDAGTKAVLATESTSSIPMLLAQHIFSAFMYAVAGTNGKKELFQDLADIQPSNSGDSTWKSFTLRNATLSAMISGIESSGLGNLADIYLSVIPPLSENQKLPQADDTIIAMAREKAKQHEQLQHWEEATKIYLWLFRTANTSKERGIFTKATAVLVEYLRQISSTIDLREGEFGYALEPLKEAQKNIEEELNKSADHQILSSLMELYAKQGREWNYAAICENGIQVRTKENNNHLEDFNFTALHQKILSGDYIKVDETLRSDLIAKDIHHWTPLHYVARIRSSYLVRKLLDGGADVDSIDLNGYTPLHYACQFSMEMDNYVCDREGTVDSLIREGADVNFQGRDGMTPLHYASMEGNEDIISALIEAGAKIDIPDASGNTPLLWAARKGGLGSTQNLWEVANKRLRDNHGRTALHLAALSGMAGTAEWLINKAGADKEARDRSKYRPLHWAAANGHEEVVDLLISGGAARDAKTSSGSTPLHCAAGNGHTNVISLLIELEGVEINSKSDLVGTPLSCAASSGHEQAVALLIRQGADIDARDTGPFNAGTTPLHNAAEQGHEKVVALLIQHGANPRVQDESGATPLHAACKGGNGDIVKLLVGLDVDIEARYTPGYYDSFGTALGPLTPLHCAAGYGHADVVRTLMDAGAKTDVSDKDKPSRLALAVFGGHVETAKQLIENGSSVHDKRNQGIFGDYYFGGRTLLQIAANNGNVELVKLLMENGADKQVEESGGIFSKTARQIASEQRQRAAKERGLEIWAGGEKTTRTVKEFDQIISLLE